MAKAKLEIDDICLCVTVLLCIAVSLYCFEKFCCIIVLLFGSITRLLCYFITTYIVLLLQH